uniref:Uncharacterized protein n=1 Tax=Panagrolaimus sp. ES5 TaxID=591445 RepID=A0AC34G076_9BILA
MNAKFVLFSAALVLLVVVQIESASVPFPFNENPSKMRITVEFDGVNGGDGNDCDAKCIKHCAKEFTTDPSGFVQCMKDCGCIPPSEIEGDENVYEIQGSDNSEKQQQPDFLSYLTKQKNCEGEGCGEKCCPVCMHKCLGHCPAKKDKSECKKHCKFFCCRDS